MAESYYRPLKAFKGRVWQYAGPVPEDPQERAAQSDWYANRPGRLQDPVFHPGAVIVPGYRGERIRFKKVRYEDTKTKGVEPGEFGTGRNSCVIEEVAQ
jgi:hypothetical protein